MQNKNIIIFSSIDWTTHRQLHHELVDNLISSGNKILFIENTGSRSFKITDFYRIKKRILDWFSSNRGYLNKDKSLTIYSPLFLPFNFFRPIVSLNSLFLSSSIIKWLRITYFDSPIVISFLPSPLVQSIINKINPQLKIYYCADLMYKPKISNKNIKKWEIKFINSVDHIFYTSLKIGEYIEKNSKKNKSTYMPNGVDYNRFRNFKKFDVSKKLKLLYSTNIGFVGGIRSIIDYELLEFIIKNINSNFIFIGPIFDKKYLKLTKYNNCFFLGHQDFNLIPSFIDFFDICIIPYSKNEFTDAIYPVKLNEYLSLGKSVVATNINELINFNNQHNIISICKTKEEFKNKIKDTLIRKKNDSKNKEKIINIAKNNTWDSKFFEVKKIMESKILNNKFTNAQNWETYSKNFRNNIIKSFSKYLITISLLFFFVFISPFYSFLGNQLTVDNNITQHEIAVILSGTKARNFLNKNYQNRVLRAINLYEENKIKKIYISSGFVQNEYGIYFIKKLLDSKGVSNKDYYIDDTFLNTTYDTLRNIHSFLQLNNYKKIIIFTDNYHSKRVELIWNSKFNTIDKIIKVDKKNFKYQWNIGLSEIKKINYEYMAILYNLFQNKI